MATYLENLTLKELSFVDFGANQHAKVTIFKRAPGAAYCDDDEEADMKRKRLDRVTALSEKVALLTKDVDVFTTPARVDTLQARIDDLNKKLGVLKGDAPGHPFRGNQFGSGEGGSDKTPKIEFNVNPKTGLTREQKERAAREMFGTGPRPKK